ncbi:MAG: NAD(P)H-dependent oxidoreductase subunit E [candidate division Zixibacteria bacterium]|nr:NAD(P)H-dependent oxidoreductase subunit E [candidate division Zixibacteria bacterium]
MIDKAKTEEQTLISMLQDIQEEYNYLPQEALVIMSKRLEIPLINIYGIATFFKSFSLTPRGKHLLTVCLGTACHVRGGPKILEEFERKLKIKACQTTKDNLYTLETVNCLGCCAIGPIVVKDGEYFGQMTIAKTGSILKKTQPLSKAKRKKKK